MWSELIAEHGLRHGEPAREADIAAAERELGFAWPHGLRALLLEADGVLDDHGFALVRPVADIVHATRQMWRLDSERLYMAFSPHLYFGQEADGDEYFFRTLGEHATDDIFVWRHEDDSRVQYGHDLRAYVDHRLEEFRSGPDPEVGFATLDALLDCVAFLALDEEPAVDDKSAVRQLELVAARLRAAPDEQRLAFATRAQDLAAKARDPSRAAFFASVSRDLGLFPEADQR